MLGPSEATTLDTYGGYFWALASMAGRRYRGINHIIFVGTLPIYYARVHILHLLPRTCWICVFVNLHFEYINHLFGRNLGAMNQCHKSVGGKDMTFITVTSFQLV